MMDIFGNDIGGEFGYETEEERRRRLEAEAATAKPITQTIKTNPVTGEQEMTIKGSVEDLSARNPLTPTVSGPVNPLDTFGRMQQVESGNRDFDAQGRPVTSPAGAMFRNQVMPATAANPGYGIRPAAAQTPEEYNRVGQEYYQAMLKQFGGDEAKAVAAYNAGPGRVQQNMQANAGQMNTQQLPKETQGYLQKVLGGALDTVIPSAQAAPAPQAVPQAVPTAASPVSPQAQAQAVQNKQGLDFAGANIPAPVAPTAQPAPQAMPQDMAAGPSTAFMSTDGWAERLNTARQDDRQLASLAYDPNTPQYVREEASADLYKKLNASKQEATAKEKLQAAVQSGDMRDIDRTMKKGGDEGSWLKYLLYGFIDPQMAKSERQKLFPDEGSKIIGFKGQDGEQGIMRIGQDGRPISGKFSDGKALTENQLIQFYQGGVSKLKPDVSTQDVEKGDMKGRVVTTYDSNNNPTTRVESGGKFYPYDSAWKPVSIGVAGAKAEATKAVELKYAGPISYTKAGADAAGEFNFKHGTNIGYQSQQPGAPLVDLNTGRAVVPNANGTITATTGGATGTAGKTPAEIQGDFEANKKNRESIAKNQQQVKQIYPFINTIKGLIDQSTSSGIGSMVDEVGNWVGYSTSGADAIAAIKPLANKVLMGVERFEGPQSDIDVKSYKEAAGQLADPKIPASQKQAAFNTIIEIMKRNAPEMDWSAYDTPAAGKSEIKIIKREKI